MALYAQQSFRLVNVRRHGLTDNELESVRLGC